MFVNSGTLLRYRCHHCSRTPKKFFQCTCSTSEFACGECIGKACHTCLTTDRYESNTTADNNVRKLLVLCTSRCDTKLKLSALEKHLSDACPRRKRLCQYSWLGCTFEGSAVELHRHEDNQAHFEQTVSSIRSMFDELSGRISSIEASTFSGPSQ